LDIKKIERYARRIRHHLFKPQTQTLAGSYKSFFRGHGIQFSEHREYQYGDDTRFIDFKIWAKYRKPFVKTFEEERNLEIAVIIDTGSSMSYGLEIEKEFISKLQVSLEICGLLMMLAEKTKDHIIPILSWDKFKGMPSYRFKGDGVSTLVGGLKNQGLIKENGTLDYEKVAYENLRVSKEEIRKKINHVIQIKKNVLLISDFIDFVEEKDLLSWFKHPTFYCCRVLSPVDILEELPYSLRVSGSAKRIAGDYEQYFFDNLLIKNKNHIVDILIDEEYLQTFIKGIRRNE
jgi:hypothetical protein